MYDDIHESLFEIVSFFNRPQQDGILLNEAGVSLELALFPLLMIIGRKGRVGIVELANAVNKDHSTVSRQVNKLVQMELVQSIPASYDKRARQVSATKKGDAMILKITAARRSMMIKKLSSWTDEEVHELRSVLTHIATTLEE